MEKLETQILKAIMKKKELSIDGFLNGLNLMDKKANLKAWKNKYNEIYYLLKDHLEREGYVSSRKIKAKKGSIPLRLYKLTSKGEKYAKA